MLEKILNAYKVSFSSKDWKEAQMQREMLKNNFLSVQSAEQRPVHSFSNAALITNL